MLNCKYFRGTHRADRWANLWDVITRPVVSYRLVEVAKWHEQSLVRNIYQRDLRKQMLRIVKCWVVISRFVEQVNFFYCSQ